MAHQKLVLAGVAAAAAAGAAAAPSVVAQSDQPPVTAKLDVLRAGPERVPTAKVRIGRRTYLFIVDTGASRTLLDRSVVRREGLRPFGERRSVGGVGGTLRVQRVRVRTWRLGDRDLPAMTVVTGELGDGARFGGLLGSDVMARYGTARFDFRSEQLVLGG
ncbi:retropepsin-like aspartic protease [Conexibacter sp. SYSU D00693]|uniref:retropepsin-like aspartic protease n=1 Tax=Conexibacter sp. SYSU D00693 TaxID=2812560 RepID=UPI00196AA473|nr:retropepsin-like aspartic protease [Conexibacter sp. SYSU D00693]